MNSLLQWLCASGGTRSGQASVSPIQRLADSIEMEPLVLLQAHSVFPYETAFFEPGRYRRHLESSTAATNDSTASPLAKQYLCEKVVWKNHCEQCALRDLENHGESYWHRSHNLPGVIVCLEHNQLLRRTPMRAIYSSKSKYRLPHDLTENNLIPYRPKEFDYTFAQHSIRLASNSMGSQVRRDAGWYRQKLADKNLLTLGSQVCSEMLTTWLYQKMGGEPQRFGYDDFAQLHRWVPHMTQSQVRIEISPVRHLLFDVALDLSQVAPAPFLDYKKIDRVVHKYCRPNRPI